MSDMQKTIKKWKSLGNLPVIAQCPESPEHFYFLLDIGDQKKALAEIVSEKAKRINEKIPDMIATLKKKVLII